MLRIIMAIALAIPSVSSAKSTDEPMDSVENARKRPDFHIIDEYPTPEYNKNNLFYIQKNTNTSVVMFEAVRNEVNEIDEKNAIHTYWIRYNEDSLTGELNYIERKLAYGTSVKKIEEQGHYTFTVVAFKNKTFEMFKNDKDEIQVNTLIGGEMARFRNVFLHIAKNFFIPEIDYIELFGEDLETGDAVYEKVIIK